MMLTLMGSAMADLLAWAKEVEKVGAVPVGTFDRAQKIVELRTLEDELDQCKQSLAILNEQNAPSLQLHLRRRIHTLRSDMLGLVSDLEQLDGS